MNVELCNGDGPDEYYDCNGNCLNDEDDDLVCDELDDCIGEYDECEICDGDGSSCSDPDVYLSLDGANDLNYTSSVDIAGFNSS